MEFYGEQYDPSANFISFNSQRDGILLYHTRLIVALDAVSIPNGMEFYKDRLQRRDIR